MMNCNAGDLFVHKDSGEVVILLEIKPEDDFSGIQVAYWDDHLRELAIDWYNDAVFFDRFKAAPQ